MSLSFERNSSEQSQPIPIKQITFAFVFHITVVVFGIMAPVATSRSRLSMTHSFLDGLLQWDSQWFATIGKYGYEFPLRIQEQFAVNGNAVPFHPVYQAAAFFPGLPLLIHFLTPTGALGLIEIVYFASLWLMYKLIHRRYPQLAYSAIILFAVNPCAIFFSALYTETLTVFSVLLIIIGLQAAHKNKSYTLSIIGIMIATSMHDLGVFAFIFTLRFVRLGLYLRAIVFVLAGAIPPIIYEVYLIMKFHTPFALLGAEATWNRTWRWPYTNVIDSLLHGPMPLNTLFVIVMSGLVIAQILFLVRKDASWRPTDVTDSLFSLETGLWMTAILLLGLCAYIPGYPLKSVLRFFCILWPAFIPTYWMNLSQTTQRSWTTFMTGIFFAFASWGAAFFTHGWFFQ